MTFISDDRWTCPKCARTVVVDGSSADVLEALCAVQKRHGKAHREAAVLSARLRNTDPDNPAPRWGVSA